MTIIDVAFVTGNVNDQTRQGDATLQQVSGETEDWAGFARQLVGQSGLVLQVRDTAHAHSELRQQLRHQQIIRRLIFVGHGGRDSRTRQSGFAWRVREVDSGMSGLRVSTLGVPRPRPGIEDPPARFMTRVLQHVASTGSVALDMHFLMCGTGNETEYAREFVQFCSGRGHQVRVHLYTGFFMTRTDTIVRTGPRGSSRGTDYVVWHQTPAGTEVRPTRQGRYEIPPADVVVPPR